MLAAIYCRISVDDNTSGSKNESILNQQLLLTNYAFEHDMQIYAIYIDENYSGLDPKRPAFLRLLEDAKCGRFQVILCKSQSRFTRDLSLAEEYLNRLFPIWGIRFLGIVDGTDTSQDKNRKLRQINGLLNEWYCEDLSQNIRTVLHKKMEAGQFIGSFACYGYTKDPNDHHRLIPDPPAAAIVRQIYEWYLDGHSMKQIASLLSKKQIPRPGEYKKQTGLLFQAPFTDNPSASPSSWSVSTIKRILSNPVYTGTLIQGREQTISCKSKLRVTLPKEQWVIIENSHPALIGNDTFEQVQQLRKKRRKI